MLTLPLGCDGVPDVLEPLTTENTVTVFTEVSIPNAELFRVAPKDGERARIVGVTSGAKVEGAELFELGREGTPLELAGRAAVVLVGPDHALVTTSSEGDRCEAAFAPTVESDELLFVTKSAESCDAHHLDLTTTSLRRATLREWDRVTDEVAAEDLPQALRSRFDTHRVRPAEALTIEGASVYTLTPRDGFLDPNAPVDLAFLDGEGRQLEGSGLFRTKASSEERDADRLAALAALLVTRATTAPLTGPTEDCPDATAPALRGPAVSYWLAGHQGCAMVRVSLTSGTELAATPGSVVNR